MSLKDEIINEIIEIEGGYVNNPNDSGGATRYGITEREARQAGYTGSMKDFPRKFAYQIYSTKVWYSVSADKLVKQSERVAREVVDTTVNCGSYRSSRILQRSLNVLNMGAELYADLVVDGDIGTKTLGALDSYLEARSEDTLVKMLNVLHGAFYVELAERREKDEDFIYGWFNNRVEL